MTASDATRSAKVRALATGPDDATLVRRARAGDEGAADTLYRRHVGLAMQTALRLLRNRAEAEDAVQESFLVAYGKLHQLHEPAAFKGWLVRIVVSKVHRRLRRQRIEPLDGLEREARSDASAAVRAELRLLDEALSALEPEERIAWTLRYVLGHKVKDVAASTGCSLSTTKRRLEAAQLVVERHVKLEPFA
ncbi:MAG: sigma-70 family RNA polymerase sigma factor [Myxococcota bacterium]